MDVDHFDPRRKKDLVQDYNNLFLASHHCNGAKSGRPTENERKAGLRFLNPCKEMDYGVHIFENPKTHELIGKTPEGIYHIRCCDLNADHLILERHDRAKLRKFLSSFPIKVPHPRTLEGAMEAISVLSGRVERMIPPFPFIEELKP